MLNLKIEVGLNKKPREALSSYNSLISKFESEFDVS